MSAPRPARRYRSVAITGGGAGLGREIALGFSAKGCIVFGTASTASEVQDLRDASAGRVSLAVCDISRSDAAIAWASGVSDALDGAGLDILICSVGISTPGPIEPVPPDTIRHAFDVTVLDTLTVINAFLPALRIARGRLVQISSWTASVPLPFDGLSAASVDRAELEPHGIEIVTVVVSAGAMEAADSAARMIEIVERQPAPEFAAVGLDAEEILRAVRSQIKGID